MRVRPFSNRLLLASLALAASIGFAAHLACGDEPAVEAAGSSQLEMRIAELIEHLGSPQFAAREKAQAQLKELGLAAFDALLDAQNHRDIEIAGRARYLLRGMPVRWSRDSDSQAVRDVVGNYGQLDRANRLNRMQLLAQLEDSQGAEALCRIMRFETDLVLSKQAALQLLGHQPSQDVARRADVARQIREAVGVSRRPAARWVRTYADALVDPEGSLEAWEQVTADELAAFDKSPDAAPRDVVQNLLRWHVDLLREVGRQEEATAKIGRIIDLVAEDYDDLFDLVDWALEREAWYVPERLAAKFPTEFSRYPRLVYRLAEGRRKLGDEEGAQQAAQRALELSPQDLRSHSVEARYLRTRQLYQWAEKELRYVIAYEGDHAGYELDAREYLSGMLFDLEREAEAAELLEGSLEIVKKDLTTFEPILPPDELQSTIDYYYGVYFGKTKEFAKQKERLTRAYEGNPLNIDIVISMYRVEDDDPKWREQTRKLLKESLDRIDGEMKVLEQALLQTINPGERNEINEAIAQKHNEWAWLVSNTEGDFDQAITRSHESLRLVPGAWAYLDTLGRCYYAAGDYKNAVLYQRQAVKDVPYMQQMQRQLKRFEDALKAAPQKAG